MKPHKHAEIIKAWADGAEIEYEYCGRYECIKSPVWDEETEYRIKPEPAAPKSPQTTMTYKQMESAYLIAGDVSSWNSAAAIFLANAAIAHACETGQVVPAATVDKLKSQSDGTEKKLLEALQDGIRREQELGDMLNEAVTIVHRFDPHRKVWMPTPKRTVYVKSFKQDEIIGYGTEARYMAIAVNVRAACYAKLPGQVSNEELRTLIDLAK